MSAIGPNRTLVFASHMSALSGKADIAESGAEMHLGGQQRAGANGRSRHVIGGFFPVFEVVFPAEYQ
jgi:hypothetical protein